MFLSYLSMTLLGLTGCFLMLIILLQRGRGGGLAGAFGGLGGQSAFGTKAGDVFTKITVVIAVIWVVLAGASGFALRYEESRHSRNLPSNADSSPDPVIKAAGEKPEFDEAADDENGPAFGGLQPGDGAKNDENSDQPETKQKDAPEQEGNQPEAGKKDASQQADPNKDDDAESSNDNSISK